MAQLQQQMDAQGVAMLSPVLAAYAPFLSPERVQEIALQCVRQQQQLGQVIEDGANPQSRTPYPIWGLKLRGGQGGEGVSKCPKDLGQAKSLDQALHHATVIALVTSPVARAVLLAHGFTLEFFQAPEDKPQLVVPN
jgi:hypothetical protein